MKIKFYTVLISAFILISFSSFAESEVKVSKTEKVVKKKNQSVAGKKSAESFSSRSAVYNRDGLVKRKRNSKKSCPAFEL